MKVKGTIIWSSTEDRLNKFKEIHAEDPLRARVFAMRNPIQVDKRVVFEESKDKFQLVEEEWTYGVSTTLKIFKRVKKNDRLLVNGDKYHIGFNASFIRQAKLVGMQSWMRDILLEKRPWMKFLQEYGLDEVCLNVIGRHKLYSPKKVYRYLYGCDIIRARAIHCYYKPKEWKCFKNWVTNVENLNVDILPLLRDTVRMSMMINKKVNASWSLKRMTLEHDQASRLITKMLFEDTNTSMSITKPYLKLNDHLGGLIRDTLGMAQEGMMQHHCVGGYVDKVNRGSCVIYHIEGYTAEIAWGYVSNVGQCMQLLQFKGKNNVAAPDELVSKVKVKIEEFNDLVKREPQTIYNIEPTEVYGTAEVEMY